MIRVFPISLLTLLLFGAGSGCTSIPQTHYYLLELGGHASHQSTHSPGGPPGLEIGVETFLVDPPYDQDRIIYRVGTDSPEMGFYAYHRWAVPLARMFPSVVAEGLRETPGVSSIEPVTPGRVYDARLEGHVLSFEEIDTPEGHKAYVQLILTLRLQDRTVVWSDTLVGEGATQISSVSAVVREMRAALASALEMGRCSLALALENWEQTP